MTQIVSTLASSLRGRGTPATPSQHCTALRCDHSSQTTCSRWTCCRSWSCSSPRARRYFPLCSARWSSNASRRPPAPSWSAQPQVLVSAAVSVQTDGREDQLESRPVSDLLVSSNQWHCLSRLPGAGHHDLAVWTGWPPPSSGTASASSCRPTSGRWQGTGSCSTWCRCCSCCAPR